MQHEFWLEFALIVHAQLLVLKACNCLLDLTEWHSFLMAYHTCIIMAVEILQLNSEVPLFSATHQKCKEYVNKSPFYVVHITGGVTTEKWVWFQCTKLYHFSPWRLIGMFLPPPSPPGKTLQENDLTLRELKVTNNSKMILLGRKVGGCQIEFGQCNVSIPQSGFWLQNSYKPCP